MSLAEGKGGTKDVGREGRKQLTPTLADRASTMISRAFVDRLLTDSRTLGLRLNSDPATPYALF